MRVFKKSLSCEVPLHVLIVGLEKQQQKQTGEKNANIEYKIFTIIISLKLRYSENLGIKD